MTHFVNNFSRTLSTSSSRTLNLRNLSFQDLDDLTPLRKAVKGGANVVGSIGIGYMTILHVFLLRNKVPEISICMESQNSIDFTVKDFEGLTPLHYVCKAKSSENAVELLSALISRIEEEREGDIVDFHAKDNKGRDFLSYAAEKELLSSLWPVVKHLSFFTGENSTCFLTSEVSLYDFGRLEGDQKFFQPLKGFSEFNQELLAVCQAEKEPSFDAISDLLSKGANPCVVHKELKCSLLHLFVKNLWVDAVDACMRSLAPIDFTIVDFEGCTPLLLLNNQLNSVKGHSILVLLISRIAQGRLNDLVDWSQTDPDCKDFFCLIAENKKLHVVCPLLKKGSFFTGDTKLTLRTVVASDWNLLSDDEKIHFLIPHGVVDDATIGLLFESFSVKPDLSEVCKLVEQGGNPFSIIYGWERSAFHQFLLRDKVSFCEECLKTKHSVDFTEADEDGCTLLHLCCLADCEETLFGLLSAIIQRLDRKIEDDKVDWTILDSEGLDFIHYAVKNKVLHVVWKLIKTQAYYSSASVNPIRITCNVTSEDWELLSEEDQKCFLPEKGVSDGGSSVTSSNSKVESQQFFDSSYMAKWVPVRKFPVVPHKSPFGNAVIGVVDRDKMLLIYTLMFSETDVIGQKEVLNETYARRKVKHKYILRCEHSQIVEDCKTNKVGEKMTAIEIFMEYGAISLERLLLQKRRKFSIIDVRNMTVQLLFALDKLHSLDIIHRNVHPRNIIIAEDGSVRLTNFVITDEFYEHYWKKHYFTVPSFLAPEILDLEEGELRGKYGKAGDIWSLGCTVLALLYHEPWGKGALEEGICFRLKHSPGIPAGVPKLCPALLSSFFSCCFERDAEKRWTTDQLLGHPWCTCLEESLEDISLS